MTGHPSIPAVRGSATLSETDDGNTQVDVKVEHLAPPEKINPQATVFVVWAQPKDEKGGNGHAQNLGALRVNDDLEGSIRAVTSLQTFDLFITAEPSSQVEAPSGESILQANVHLD